MLEVPRGFSVHVFKTPSPPAYAQPGTMKTDYPLGRSPSSLGRKQPSYPSPPRPESTRKPSFGQATDYFGDQSTEYDRALDVSRSKAQKQYSIYPGAIPDTYIYERSISSMSDLPGSPSSSSSSDTESIDTPIEVSSIRATSSVETLEATLYAAQNNKVSPVDRSPYGTAFVPPPTKGRPLVVPPNPRFPPGAADDDSSTVVSDDQPQQQQQQQLARIPGPTPVYPVVPSTTPLVVPPIVPAPPVRRNSDDRAASRGPAPPPLTRRDSSQPAPRTVSPTSSGSGSGAGPNVPPGLQYVAPPMAGGMARRPSISSPVTPGAGGRSPSGERPPLTRMASSSSPDGGPQKRSVRWTEDLVCPSPVPPSQRRKGWFNRRG